MKYLKKYNEHDNYCTHCNGEGKEPYCSFCGKSIDYGSNSDVNYGSDDDEVKDSRMSGKFFFAQDCSTHWYMIPVELKDQWNKLNTSDEDDQDTIDEFEKIFAEYRTGGDISNITFENPSK